MTSSTATLSCRLVACLVLVGSAALAPAADPPPTASPSPPDADVTRELANTQRDACRLPATTAGVEAVTSLHIRTFQQLGLFPAASGATPMVTQEDFDHLERVVSRRHSHRRESLHALDHWMFLLEQSKQDDKDVRATLTLLRGYAVRLEADEPDKLPLRQVRKAVAARDADALAALFEGEKKVSDDMLRQFPGCLYGQVHTVLSKALDPTAALSLKKLARLRPTDPALHVLLVNASRTPAQASRYAYALLLSDPDNPAYHSLLGQLLFDAATGRRLERCPDVRNFRDEYDVDGVSEAVEHFRHAVRLNAEQKRIDPHTHYRLGVACGYSDEWRTGQAVNAFEAAVREAALVGQTSDDAALYHLALAQSLQVLGRDPNRVIREAEQCIKLCNARSKPPVVPGTPKPGVSEPLVASGPEELVLAHVVVGRAYLDLGRAADAATSLTTAIRHRPKSASAWLWLGKAYFACGETRQAVEATNRAHKLEPTDAEVLSTLGEYALSEGDPERASECFSRAKEQASKSSRLSASQPGRLVSTDDGILRAEQLAAARSLGSNAATCKNAKPTIELGRAATTRKRYSDAARIFQSLLTEPDFNDATGEVARLAVGAAVRAGRDGLFGDCNRQADAEAFHALARKWADEELNRVRKELEQVFRGKGSLTREDLLVRLTDFQTDPLLAAVREPYLQAKLGAGERRSWESFWDAVNETALSVRGLPTLDSPTLGGGRGGGLGGF